MNPRIRYLTDLLKLLMLQQVQQPSFAHLVTDRFQPDSVAPKELVMQIHSEFADLLDAVHTQQDVETILALVGDLLLRLAVFADVVQTTGTTLSVPEQDALRLGEWLLTFAPDTMVDSKSISDAALKLLKDYETRGRFH